MRAIKQYIIESILDDDDDIQSKSIKIQPKTRHELVKTITDFVLDGVTDLNFIDISLINDMNYIFFNVNHDVYKKTGKHINVDVSRWDVSHVKKMDGMFQGCAGFNCDISGWDVSKCINMDYMFFGCVKFDQDLSGWKPNEICDMEQTFDGTKLEENGNLPDWYTEDD